MEPQQGKAAIFTVLFLMSLSLNVQSPVFTPYAVTLGATGLFISIMLSSSSLTNLSGNIIAGPFIDKIGKKPFIVVPLFLSSFLMVGHAFAENAGQLFMLRVSNGFTLAFLGPACFALLSTYAKNTRQQGKNMAINGMMVTIAGVVAPFAGGHLVRLLGYSGTYWIIGSALFVTAVIAMLSIKENELIVVHRKEKTSFQSILTDRNLLPVYFVGFALMYVHGTLTYELPFLTVEHGFSTAETGKLFSLMGIGVFAALSLFWLNGFSALLRTAIGMSLIGFFYYDMSTSFLSIDLGTVLFGIGVSFGLIFPALTTLLTEKVSQDQYGSAFGILSAVFSLGIIVSSMTSGIIREFVSPYYPAFLVAMCSTIYVIYDYMKTRRIKTPLKI